MAVALRQLKPIHKKKSHKVCFFKFYKHCVKSVQINLRIQSEYRKIRTRNNSVFGHFSSSKTSKKNLKIQESKNSIPRDLTRGIHMYEWSNISYHDKKHKDLKALSILMRTTKILMKITWELLANLWFLKLNF